MNRINLLHRNLLHHSFGLTLNNDPIVYAKTAIQATFAFDQNLVRNLETLRFQKTDTVFEELPCGACDCKPIQEIITAAKRFNFSVFLGKFCVFYEDIYEEKVGGQTVYDVISIRDREGFSVELVTDWKAVDEFSERPAIKILFFKVPKDSQGSFYRAHKFLVGKIRRLLLDELGYKMIYGSARYSTNSEIRFPLGIGGLGFDWRREPHFVGLDPNLKPLIVSGLQLFYMRLGLTPIEFGRQRLPSYSDEAFSSDTVLMLGEGEKDRVINRIGVDGFREFNSQSRENIDWWRQIQISRRKQLPDDVLQSMIESALESTRRSL